MKSIILLGLALPAAAWTLTAGDEAAAEESSCCAVGETAQASLVMPVSQPVVRFKNAPAETGAIVGTVKWDGDLPDALAPLSIEADKAEGCDTGGAIDRTNRSRLIAKTGGIANVVVSVEVDGLELELPDDPFVLDQRGCRYEPHVLVVPRGGKVRFLNSDRVNHNVHTYPKRNDQMNRNMSGGSSEEQTLREEEIVEVKCDIHPWMKSWLYVTENQRWDVSAEDGTFRIDGLPPGTYKVSYWHEEIAKGTTEEVTVSSGGEAGLNFTMGASKSKGRRGRR